MVDEIICCRLHGEAVLRMEVTNRTLFTSADAPIHAPGNNTCTDQDWWCRWVLQQGDERMSLGSRRWNWPKFYPRLYSYHLGVLTGDLTKQLMGGFTMKSEWER